MKARHSKKNSRSTGRTIGAAAAELGLAPRVLEELMGKMVMDSADFVTGEGILTPTGFEKIRTSVEQTMQSAAAATVATAAVPVKADTQDLVHEDLRVARIFRGSPRVLAERSNGLEVVLQVKTSELLEVGMLLKGCEQGEMCWFYTGRLPRTTGERQLYFPERADPVSSHE